MRERTRRARRSTPFWMVLSLAGSSISQGCGIDTAISNPVPVIGTALNRDGVPNQGLVTGLDERGWPLRAGDGMDPAITEARRYYDTVQSPCPQAQPVDYPDPFSGAPAAPRKTAPLTLDAWKQDFHIPVRGPNESIANYRSRTGVVIYYTMNELEPGRELGCAEFDDKPGAGGVEMRGIACYVTNYGAASRDTYNSLRMAAEGLHPKNTVSLTYRPSAAPDYQIQFYAYDGQGKRLEWAQFDTLGPRPVPQVCLNCHGGYYDRERHLARSARFLPIDPNLMSFADGSAGTSGLTRAAQEERLRKINALSTRTPLTPAQREMLDELYGGALYVPGTASRSQWYPRAWRDTAEHRQLFDQVVKPNCTTCHQAMQTGPQGPLAVYDQFASPSAFLDTGLSGAICGTFDMPNAEATRTNFWQPAGTPIIHDGVPYDAPADVLLAQLGMDRAQCAQLAAVSNCNRGPNPDELCGNAFSGTACNRVTGKCVPELGASAPTDPTQPNGVCKLNGSRRCPYPEQCQPGGPPPAGLEGFDGVCVP
jgi:hypothetical protein